MPRLLTGHTVTFNQGDRRCGRLFQNRSKSIPCEENLTLWNWCDAFIQTHCGRRIYGIKNPLSTVVYK